MNWKKRTQAEIDYSADKLKDNTGGYEFLPWLIWMRKMYIVGFLGNVAFSVAGYKFFFEETDWVGLGVGIFFTLSSILIGYKIRQDYTDGKKGISR